MKRTKRMQNLIALIAILIAIGFDQWSKYLAVTYLKDKPSVSLLSQIFELQYLENRGASFGILQNQQWFFVISGILVLILALILYLRMPYTKRFYPLRICILGITAGAIGNMIDRVRLNYVIDFFYAKCIDFPIFNVADIYVTLSTIGLVLLILFYYTEEEMDQLYASIKRKKKNEAGV